MESKKKDKTLVSHFIITGLGIFISMALGLVSMPIITRISSPDEYGRFTIFSTYASILIAISFLGLDTSIIRFFYNYKDLREKRNLLFLCMLIPSIVSILLIFILYFLNKFDLINVSLSNYYLVLLSLFIITTILNTISINLLRLTFNSKFYSVCTIVQKVIYCVVLIISIFIRQNDLVTVLVFANILSLVFSSIIAIIVTKDYWYIKDLNLPENIGEITKYSLPLGIYSIVYVAFDSLDKLLVDKYCTKTEVGIYSSALTIVGIILLIKVAFDAIWSPAQTEHYTNNLEDKEFIKKGNKYITILMFFVGINIIMFKDIICLILGESYRGAGQIIPFLIFNPIMAAISLTTVSGIEISKKSYLQTVISVICLVIFYAIGNLIIPKFGLKGASITVAISYIVLYILRLYFSNKYYYIDYEFWKTIVLIVITLIFAYINTYYLFSILTIIVYIICMLTIWVLYKRDIINMFEFIKESLINR